MNLKKFQGSLKKKSNSVEIEFKDLDQYFIEAVAFVKQTKINLIITEDEKQIAVLMSYELERNNDEEQF